MNLKKIIIYQQKVLFNIFSELENKLNLDFVEADHTNFSYILKNINTDFLIISNSKKNNFKNHLIIEENPIKLENLELINIALLREKFSYQSDIAIGKYKLNLNSKEISKNNITIDLTEREMNLILFLKQKSDPVKIDELQKEVWEYGSDLETHTVETHIYRLRKKLKKKFKDDNFIISSKKGYFLN